MRDLEHCSWRAVWIVFGSALILRLIYLGIVFQEPANLSAPDSPLYQQFARDMIDTGGFNLQTAQGNKPVTVRVPGYVAYLAAVRTLFGPDPLWPVLGQCLLDSITCVLIGLLAAQVSPGLFLLAGLCAAVNLNLIVHSALILSDSLFLLPFTASLLMTVRFIRAPTRRDALLAGLFLTLALLTRSVVLYLVPLVLVVMGIAAWRHKAGWGFPGQAVMACLLPLVVLVGPLVLRNAKEYGYYSLTSQGGTHVLFWVVPLAREFSRGIPFAQTQDEMRGRLELLHRQRGLSGYPENPFEDSRLHMEIAQVALQEMSAGELAWAWGTGAAINLFTPSLTSFPSVSHMERPSFYRTQGSTPVEKARNFLSQTQSMPYFAVMVPAVGLTLLFRCVQMMGLITLVRAKPVPVAPLVYLLLVGLYILLVTGPVVGVKYRLPLEPMFIILTAAALNRWWEARRTCAE